DDGRLEMVEGRPIVLSLLQYRLPTQTRLRSFEDQELEQQPVVMDRHTPFGIVIPHIQVGLRPRATVHLSPQLASPCSRASPTRRPCAHADRPESRSARPGPFLPWHTAV